MTSTDASASTSTDELDRLLAQDLGPYLRIYVATQLHIAGDPADPEARLEELFAALISADAFVYAGDRAGFQSRLYGLVDRALPHLGRPALRRPLAPEVAERARRFVTSARESWHAGYAEVLERLLALEPREREAILWRDFHALSMAEIGRRLGLEREEARVFVDGIRARQREACRSPDPER